MCEKEPLTQKCDNCGNRCERCNVWDAEEGEFTNPPTCGNRETMFEGNDVQGKFGLYLFHPQHKGSTVFAHNMKGYDGYFILEHLISRSIYPDNIIYAGSKIMYMSVGRGLNIRIVDSLNFLPMKLAALPKAFALTELKKGWFPHLFNTKENQNYIGPFPDMYYYGVDYLSSKERLDLMTWHAQQRGKIFNFREEIRYYCQSDVDILRRACARFRELMVSATSDVDGTGGIDPFSCVTIASVCMKVFKSRFLREEHNVAIRHQETLEERNIKGFFQAGKWTYLLNDQNIDPSLLNGEGWEIISSKFASSPLAKVPVDGYVARNQYSRSSIEWLQWLAHSRGVNIQHALNGRGEHTVPGTRYKLDGYDPDNHTVYEFHGCVYDGCVKCFKINRTSAKISSTQQPLSVLYDLTLKKKSDLRRLGYKYVCIWECEYLKQLKVDVAMRDFGKNLDLQTRLNPWDSFFGGRTNANRLHCRVQDGEEIKYVDVISLYPFVNKYAMYPVGHPKIITRDSADIREYFGLVKATVLPSRGLMHPILPYRTNGKLKFPLCRTCADTESKSKCECSDEQRCLTGVWCSPEVVQALNGGYVITRVHEIYDWERTAVYDSDTKKGDLFAGYINTFLKFKQEASGWPVWCESDDDKKDRYILHYADKEGIKLSPGASKKTRVSAP